jgi:hypothetical protein
MVGFVHDGIDDVGCLDAKVERILGRRKGRNKMLPLRFFLLPSEFYTKNLYFL